MPKMSKGKVRTAISPTKRKDLLPGTKDKMRRKPSRPKGTRKA